MKTTASRYSKSQNVPWILELPYKSIDMGNKEKYFISNNNIFIVPQDSNNNCTLLLKHKKYDMATSCTIVTIVFVTIYYFYHQKINFILQKYVFSDHVWYTYSVTPLNTSYSVWRGRLLIWTIPMSEEER